MQTKIKSSCVYIIKCFLPISFHLVQTKVFLVVLTTRIIWSPFFLSFYLILFAFIFVLKIHLSFQFYEKKIIHNKHNNSKQVSNVTVFFNLKVENENPLFFVKFQPFLFVFVLIFFDNIRLSVLLKITYFRWLCLPLHHTFVLHQRPPNGLFSHVVYRL